MNRHQDLIARAVDLAIDGVELDDDELTAVLAADSELQASFQQYRAVADELRAKNETATPTGGFAALSQRMEAAIRNATTEPSVAPNVVVTPARWHAPRWAVAATIAVAAAGWTLYLANLFAARDTNQPPTTAEIAGDEFEREQIALREQAQRRSLAATAELAQQSTAIIESLAALREELGAVARQVRTNSERFDDRNDEDSLVAQLTQALRESPGGHDAAQRFELVLAKDEVRIEQALAEGVDGEAYRILLNTLETYRAILQVTANNLANTETIGFKRDRVVLEDIGYREAINADAADMQEAANSIALGLGSRVAKHEFDFSQGVVQSSTRALDLAIEGGGLFSLADNTGRIWYTRAGNFVVDADGRLAWQNEQYSLTLSPELVIPPDAVRIVIRHDGSVEATTSDQFDAIPIGQIQLARFTNLAGLKKAGRNLYEAAAEAGAATLAAPGSAGLGFVRQFALEQSNVDPQLEKLDFERAVRTIRVLRQLLRQT